jgi:predicted RecA/RadA family phage recombinase
MPSYDTKRSVRKITAASNLVCGDVLLTTDSYAGIVEAQRGIPNGEVGNVNIEGLVEFAKTASSDVIAAGDRIQYNTTTKVASVLDFGAPASGSILVGVASRASANGVPTVLVDLNGQGPTPDIYGIVKQRRVRVTTAEVNAGLTILPAIAGFRYRLSDAKMIAIGGAAATATSVDILATQSASSVKLVAAAVAGLTQSAVLRAGATNSAVLADGASFNVCDANTAITVAKTGSSLATATHIDFIIDYVVEPA